VQRGVRLHRLIDGFTDRHPVTLRSITRVAREAGWYGGIVIDIYYDHVLAREWARYSSEPLPSFAARSYDVLKSAVPELPDVARDFIKMFVESDRLNLYATREGILDTLARVSRVIAKRIPNKPIWLPDMMPLLVARDAEIAADFHAFYPELMAFVAEQKGK
jgi:acyl carrier protein phosphodiesterase